MVLPPNTTAIPQSLQRNANTPHLDVPGTRLWRVVFKDDYASAVVLDHKNEIKIPEFTLFDWRRGGGTLINYRFPIFSYYFTYTSCGLFLHLQGSANSPARHTRFSRCRSDENTQTRHYQNHLIKLKKFKVWTMEECLIIQSTMVQVVIPKCLAWILIPYLMELNDSGRSWCDWFIISIL